jgi:hypothetical protein
LIAILVPLPIVLHKETERRERTPDQNRVGSVNITAQNSLLPIPARPILVPAQRELSRLYRKI